MAADPRHTGQAEDEIDDKPQAAQSSDLWPESASMPAQQSAANEMFRQNSERLQQAANKELAQQSEPEQQHEPSPAEENPGNYSQLKQEHADITNDQALESENTQGADDPEIPMPENASHINYADLKQDHADIASQEVETDPKREQESGDRELRFVKDDERSKEESLEQEHPEEPGDQMRFVKDRSQGLDHSR
jgi:hypothetical protein